MTSPYRLLSCAILLVLACGDDANSTSVKPDTDGLGTTTAPMTTGSTGEPTTTSGTTGTPTTTEATTATTDDSTTGPPPAQCSQHQNQSECGAAGCEWAQIVSYTHGTQGCQGSIRDFCIPAETSGGLTSVWRDNGGDIEVLQFAFDPTDLGPDWQTCDCDGPLACLCTAAALDCPERLSDFCGAISGQNACTNAAAAGEFVCGWFTVSQEGPLDGKCDDPPWKPTCLPGTDLSAKTCDPISLPYVDQGYCQGWTDPVYWRDNGGIIEVTTVCGPKPVGWNLCVADDPNQPEECKCGCKI